MWEQVLFSLIGIAILGGAIALAWKMDRDPGVS